MGCSSSTQRPPHLSAILRSGRDVGKGSHLPVGFGATRPCHKMPQCCVSNEKPPCQECDSAPGHGWSESSIGNAAAPVMEEHLGR